jgi:hypothetical protein
VDDHTITNQADWIALRPEVIVDPMIYRLGEIFLAGPPDGGGDAWGTVSKDLGGLVTFFDLLVLHERLPAFNYAATFDALCHLGAGLFTTVNSRVDVLQQVIVAYEPYMDSKSAALDTLRRRVTDDPAAPLQPASLRGLAEELAALEYRWHPSLEDLEPLFAGEARTGASFLLGTLVLSTYAQRTGAPHVMSPKRSRLFTASALAAPSSGYEVEERLYAELGRRFNAAGEGWRDRELAWTPSFVPWLLRDLDPFRTSPADLLDKVFELREQRAVTEYRQVRAGALAGDDHAVTELGRLADAMSAALRADRAELAGTRTVLVELMPKAFGAAAGALAGAAAAGPLGAALGATMGVAGEELLKRVTGTVWGFVFERLPFVSARKLLTRAARTDHDTMARLEATLRTIWQTPPRRRSSS